MGDIGGGGVGVDGGRGGARRVADGVPGARCRVGAARAVGDGGVALGDGDGLCEGRGARRGVGDGEGEARGQNRCDASIVHFDYC